MARSRCEAFVDWHVGQRSELWGKWWWWFGSLHGPSHIASSAGSSPAEAKHTSHDTSKACSKTCAAGMSADTANRVASKSELRLIGVEFASMA
ncbi:MAG: hypothetical protein IIB99_09180 [Planctomycetes bacterium]|nr:hypothetical protein [Planctomycetota bacterium]